MNIAQIQFGKNLRPTTVDLVKKVNEIITAVNDLNTSEIEQLITDVDNNLKQLKNKVETNTTDISKMKVTLYTPLAEEDTDPENR